MVSNACCEPAHAHASTHVNCIAGALDIPAKAMEVDCAKAAMHMLVEKPISMRPAEEVERLAQVCSAHAHVPNTTLSD